MGGELQKDRVHGPKNPIYTHTRTIMKERQLGAGLQNPNHRSGEEGKRHASVLKKETCRDTRPFPEVHTWFPKPDALRNASVLFNFQTWKNVDF